MYDVYAERSPNVYKVTICLAELGEAWRDVWVDVARGAQHAPEFHSLCLNGRVPVLVDHAPADGGEQQVVWESGSILVYLAEKSGRFLPPPGRARTEALTWVFWQMAGLGPMCGQNAHFLQYDPPNSDYAKQRYHTEVERLYRVLDQQLQGRDWIAGDYSVADMACFPWVRMAKPLMHDVSGLTNLMAWRERMAARPAVVESYRRMELLPKSDATKAERFTAMSPASGLAAVG
jgi:GST-like protein